MEWVDDGIVLSARRFGETSAVASLLCRDHGRHAGLIRGFNSRRGRGVLATGNGVRARWRGRTANHLGAYTCELTNAVAAGLIADGDRLAALASACAMVETTLAEHEPHPRAFDGLVEVLAALVRQEGWRRAYLRWELSLLAELGFGLELTRCAVTGRSDQLAFVSPKTGRAVTAAVGAPYRDKLLKLPPFMSDPEVAAVSGEDMRDALALTAYFFKRHVYDAVAGDIPPARLRLAERLTREPAPPR
ncbi:MAG: DNA repair protein RecO [Rhodospirillales bacterium]|nr:DNA repair protein RecO [Rhodospirillales bacterium]